MNVLFFKEIYYLIIFPSSFLLNQEKIEMERKKQSSFGLVNK